MNLNCPFDREDLSGCVVSTRRTYGMFPAVDHNRQVSALFLIKFQKYSALFFQSIEITTLQPEMNLWPS